MRKTILSIVALALLGVLQLPADGQSTYHSVYSRFGPGDLYQYSNAVNGAMGGLKYGFRTNFLVNPSNPASYSAFSKNFLVFDAGLQGSAVRMTSDDKVRDDGHFNLGTLSFGIPLTEKWSGALGLAPYSSVGYSIADPGFDEKFGGYNTVFKGEGGIHRVFAGTAYNITKNLSAGVNANYLFGSLNYLQTVTFDSTNFLNLRSEKSRVIHDFAFDAGVQYQHPINTEKETWLIAGVAAGLPAALSAREDVLTETFKYSGTGVVIIKDTVEYTKGDKGTMKIPLNVAAGLSLRRSDRWLVGIDFSMQDWSGFEAFGIRDSLKRSMQIALGGQYKVSNVYLRGGARIHQTYLEIRGTRLNEVGISFGVGVPVYNKAYSVSMVSVGVELGQRGTTEQGLIKEQFGRIWLNFTMNQERWFKRRQYI